MVQLLSGDYGYHVAQCNVRLVLITLDNEDITNVVVVVVIEASDIWKSVVLDE